jgi:hypothetical protein
MPKEIYIALGNHRSMVGVKEIVYSLQSALSDKFSVKFTRELKADGINIVIDEFSALFDVSAIRQTKARYPKTKIVITATEFVTPVSVLGIGLMNTFNFFGSLRDWRTIAIGAMRPLLGGAPSYMHMRYLGFISALKYCDLLTVVHPLIGTGVSDVLQEHGPHLAKPLMVYPRIGQLSPVQIDRLWNLPLGFTMTGTHTYYRSRISRDLIRKFARAGWFAPIYRHVPFEAPNAEIAPDDVSMLAEYHAISPEYLFNINPPQTETWPYSSPMRILRAMLLGQIPVVSKRFNDHLLENVAILWDGKPETAVELGTRQLLDRRMWLPDYLRSLEIYDSQAREANKPFVDAMIALAEDVPSAEATEPAFATLSRVGQRR